MRIVHLSYARITNYADPIAWLKRLDFFVALLEEMSSRTEVISVHCINYEGDLSKNNVAYHFEKLSKFEAYFPIKLHRYVAGLNADVIIVHGLHLPWQSFLLRHQVGKSVKIVMQHHAEQPLRFHKSWLQKIVDKDVAAYFFTAKELARPWLKEEQIADERKINVVMEVPSVFNVIDKREAIASAKMMTGKNYLWVGRFDENKDPLTLIKGFIKFAAHREDVHLHIIHQSSELIEHVTQLITQSTVSKQIQLIGKVAHDELVFWYNAADFILSTSHYESGGAAVCEGMSCGCIPILTDIAPFQMMTDQRCGLIFRSGDENDLSLALEISYGLDIKLEREKVLKVYDENLSLKAISNKMLIVLNQIR